MDAEQDWIPYMGQLVLANVPVDGWIIDHYEHSLLDGSGKGIWLPVYYGETFQYGMVT